MAEIIILVLLLTPTGPFLFIHGARELRRAWRNANPADLPRAQVVDGRARGPRSSTVAKIGAVVEMLFGAALSAGLALVIYVIFDISQNGLLGKVNSKGRLLRIREHAHLPPAAAGAGWTDATTPDLGGIGAWERAVLGQAWLLSARMEHASVAAFAQLSLHLAALAAPAPLVERTHAAALDEIRHAQRCFALASAYAGKAWSAGAIAELGKPSRGEARPMTFERLACGSLVDGCLAEGLAADVARAAAERAVDPVVRATFVMIAADEARHAELAWDVMAWCIEQGGRSTRAALAARLERLDDELTPRLPDVPGITRHRLRERGLLHQDDLGVLAKQRLETTKRRALAMTGAARATDVAA